MADLAEILPHVHFIQAKFFEIDDDLHDLHVPGARSSGRCGRAAGPAGCLASTRGAANHTVAATRSAASMLCCVP
jgi:hypothetical protein